MENEISKIPRVGNQIWFSTTLKVTSILVLITLALGLRLNRYSDLGMQADESVAVVAASQIESGRRLYADLFWNHTPGIPFLLSQVFHLFGQNYLHFRMLSIICGLMTTLCIFWIAGSADYLRMTSSPAGGSTWARQSKAQRQEFNWMSGFLAGLFFATAPLAIFWARLSMLESFETAFASGCIAFAVQGLKRRNWYWWLGVGVMAGLASLSKISGLVVVVTIGVFLVGWGLIQRNRYPLLMELVVLLGIAIVWLPVFITLIMQGTLDDFFHLASGADRLAPLENLPGKLSDFFFWSLRSPLVPLGLVGVYFSIRSRRLIDYLLLLWLGMEFTLFLTPPYIEFGWSGFSHYCLPLIAATSVFAGTGLYHLLLLLVQGWRGFKHKSLALTLFIILILLAVSLTLPRFKDDFQYAVFDTEYPSASTLQETEIGELIASMTPPGSEILVFGNSAFYYWSGLAPANRFFHYPAYLPESNLRDVSDQELVDSLINLEPSLVLISETHRNRLSPAIDQVLETYWQKELELPYKYQGKVSLFLPRSEFMDTSLSHLHKDRLVGRFDPKLDRKLGVMHLNALYLEPGIEPDDEFTAGVAAVMRDSLSWHGAKYLEIEKSEPPGFGAKLKVAL